MSRYAQAHQKPAGPGDARPTALEIVQDEGLDGKLTGKVFLITGVSSGIGVEAMRALYATGGHVFGTVRNLPKGQAVVNEIKATTKGGDITLIEMELDNLASVRKGAEQFLGQSNALHVLINNAGVMATPRGKTKDGFETQFATNHLGHFYLFQLLKQTLLQSATPLFPSRVVSVSSIGHRLSPVRFHDYHFEEEDSYTPWIAYGQSKTANIYFSNEGERRYGSKCLHFTSVHPGGIDTGLLAHVPDLVASMRSANPLVNNYMKSAPQGAATPVYAALSKEWRDKGGRFLSDCREAGPFKSVEAMSVEDDGYEKWAFDEIKEKRLWKDSLKMVGLEDDE